MLRSGVHLHSSAVRANRPAGLGLDCSRCQSNHAVCFSMLYMTSLCASQVCFNMFVPTLLRNFFYRAPRTHSWRLAAKDWVLHLVSRDLGCAVAMSRRFYWCALHAALQVHDTAHSAT